MKLGQQRGTGQRASLGTDKESEEGECDRESEEENAEGNGHRRLPQKVCGAIHQTIHSFTYLLCGRH